MKRAKGTKIQWTAAGDTTKPTKKPAGQKGKCRKERTVTVWKSESAKLAATRTKMYVNSFPLHFKTNEEQLKSALANALHAGAAFVTKVPMYVQQPTNAYVDGDGTNGYPFPVLSPSYSNISQQDDVKTGTLFIYVGTVRCKERMWLETKSKYVIVDVNKHTFVTPLGMCIIHNLNNVVEPATTGEV